MKKIVTIQGTHCQACKTLIEEIAKEIPGVISATVDFATGQTSIEHDVSFDLQKFKTEVEKTGNYSVTI